LKLGPGGGWEKRANEEERRKPVKGGSNLIHQLLIKVEESVEEHR
jgi:hypothetical protein